jgi:hypothetical protein
MVETQIGPNHLTRELLEELQGGDDRQLEEHGNGNGQRAAEDRIRREKEGRRIGRLKGRLERSRVVLTHEVLTDTVGLENEQLANIPIKNGSGSQPTNESRQMDTLGQRVAITFVEERLTIFV